MFSSIVPDFPQKVTPILILFISLLASQMRKILHTLLTSCKSAFLFFFSKMHFYTAIANIGLMIWKFQLHKSIFPHIFFFLLFVLWFLSSFQGFCRSGHSTLRWVAWNGQEYCDWSRNAWLCWLVMINFSMYDICLGMAAFSPHSFGLFKKPKFSNA